MNVLGLMREAGFKMGGGLLCFQPELEKFAELVRSEALEEAAKWCEAEYQKSMNPWLIDYAAAIRGLK